MTATDTPRRRTATRTRVTKETSIEASLDLDGLCTTEVLGRELEPGGPPVRAGDGVGGPLKVLQQPPLRGEIHGVAEPDRRGAGDRCRGLLQAVVGAGAGQG